MFNSFQTLLSGDTFKSVREKINHFFLNTTKSAQFYKSNLIYAAPEFRSHDDETKRSTVEVEDGLTMHSLEVGQSLFMGDGFIPLLPGTNYSCRLYCRIDQPTFANQSVRLSIKIFDIDGNLIRTSSAIIDKLDEDDFIFDLANVIQEGDLTDNIDGYIELERVSASIGAEYPFPVKIKKLELGIENLFIPTNYDLEEELLQTQTLLDQATTLNNASAANFSEVDNTSDIDKPVSTATQSALDEKVDSSQVLTNVPEDAVFTDTITSIIDDLTSGNSDMALSAHQGFVLKALIDDINVLLASDETTIDDLQEVVDYIKVNRSDLDNLSINGISGLQSVLDSKVEVSAISNVDNTSDSDKPISIANQEALDGKVDNTELNQLYSRSEVDNLLALQELANAQSIADNNAILLSDLYTQAQVEDIVEKSPKFLTVANLTFTDYLSQDIAWQNEVNVITSGNNIERGTGFGWSSSGASAGSIDAGTDFVLTADVPVQAEKFIFGVSVSDNHQNFTDLTYGILHFDTGNVRVYENGSNKGSLGYNTDAASYQIVRKSGVITYHKNWGGAIYQSASASTTSLVFDCSIYDTDSKIENIEIYTKI